MNLERRFLAGPRGPVRVEQRGEGAPAVLTGYAAVFYDPADAGTEYRFDGFWADYAERIMPGAFDRALKEDDVRALFNHSPSQLLGRTASGTLALSVDAKGLRYEITPPDTELGRSVTEAVRRGDLSGSSFAFVPTDTTFREVKADGKELVIREVNALELYDVGPVTFPAYKASTTGVRSAGELDEARKAFEAWKAGRRAAGPSLAARLAGYRARAVEVGG